MAVAHALQGTSAGGTTTGDVKRAFDFSVSDFATIVTTTAYVDKSLMIRDVYNASSRFMITAPPRFGKSTNLDMIKRFFEVEVDARGNPKTVHTTNNYKLFNDYNLEICKDISFFNEHFGKHPVVHIDFKLLGSVDTSAEILDAFKIIVENSLNQHSYILQSSWTEHVFSTITGFNVNDFRKYVSDGITKDVDGLNLAKCFTHLCTILKRFFGKKVLVLIDSYDAFLVSPVIKNQTDGEKIMSFVKSSVGQLLSNINCVERVLITGVIPVIGEGFVSNNIERCHFLDSHPFTKYYGLTSSEVDTVLSKVIQCDEERRDVKSTINYYYNAYESRDRDIRLYNVWSVMQYICRRTMKSYWCERRYINIFKKCFKIEPIRQEIENLLLGKDLELDISQPLSMTDVNSMITSCKAGNPSEMELFFVLLYHFGYLSVISELCRGIIRVNIPSEEIKYELAKTVFYENRELYSSPAMNGILSVLDECRPDAADLNYSFHTYMRDLYRHIYFDFTSFSEKLFMNLVASARYSHVMRHKLGPVGPTAVLLQNIHKVAICVTDGGHSASSTHQKVTNGGGEERIFNVFNDVRGKFIIAISFDYNGKFEIAYSYYLKTGDNLREVRTIPLREIRTIKNSRT